MKSLFASLFAAVLALSAVAAIASTPIVSDQDETKPDATTPTTEQKDDDDKKKDDGEKKPE